METVGISRDEVMVWFHDPRELHIRSCSLLGQKPAGMVVSKAHNGISHRLFLGENRKERQAEQT
jgi:hypothetical protein